MIHQPPSHESGDVAWSVTRDVEALEQTAPPQRDRVVILQELERTQTSRPHESSKCNLVSEVGFIFTQAQRYSVGFSKGAGAQAINTVRSSPASRYLWIC